MTAHLAGRRHRHERLLADLDRAMLPVARVNPLAAPWRWRYELLLAALATAAGLGIARVGVGLWMVAVAAEAGVALGLFPRLRRFLRARVWCLVTPHRIRTGCAAAGVASRRGRLPAVLLTSARPYGERVWLWCPAGVSAHDLAVARPALRAACWAADIRVTRHDRYAQLVALDVLRGDDRGV